MDNPSSQCTGKGLNEIKPIQRSQFKGHIQIDSPGIKESAELT